MFLLIYRRAPPQLTSVGVLSTTYPLRSMLFIGCFPVFNLLSVMPRCQVDQNYMEEMKYSSVEY